MSPAKFRWLMVFGGMFLFLLVILGVFMAFEWRPEPFSETPIKTGLHAQRPAPPSSLSLMSWNIGYAGLGKNADFFMDGGKQVRPAEKTQVEENLSSIQDRIRSTHADVYLFQEVDIGSSRSFGIHQVEYIVDIQPQWSHTRAINFKVPWIPYPILNPLGKVESGLLGLSRFAITKATRHQLPGNHPWPVRVFHLKRCLHELHIPAPDGKDWVIIHIHLSVFDDQGSMRTLQMNFLKDLMTSLALKGQHVIVGGDWNHALPGVHEDTFLHRAETPDWFREVPEDWTPKGWKWAFDTQAPSLRATNKPYIAHENFVTTVDGFLVSPEIIIDKVETQDLGFVHADHNPVWLKASLSLPKAEE